MGEVSKLTGTREQPNVSPLQKMKSVGEWTLYEVRAFLLWCKYNSVVKPSIMRVGFTGRVLLLMNREPEKYWEAWLNETTVENHDVTELFKQEVLAVNTTAEQWKKEQNDFSMKYFGERLLVNNFYDDGVIFFLCSLFTLTHRTISFCFQYSFYVDYPWNLEIVSKWSDDYEEFWGHNKLWFQNMQCGDRESAIIMFPIQNHLHMYPVSLHKMETPHDRFTRLLRNYEIDYDHYVFHDGRRYHRYTRLFNVEHVPNGDNVDDVDSGDDDGGNEYAKMIKKYATTTATTDEIPSKKAKYDDEATKDYMRRLDDIAACLTFTPRFCPRLEKPDPNVLYYCRPENRQQDKVFVSLEHNHYLAVVDRPWPYPLGVKHMTINPVSHVYVNFRERLSVHVRMETTEVGGVLGVSFVSFSFLLM